MLSSIGKQPFAFLTGLTFALFTAAVALQAPMGFSTKGTMGQLVTWANESFDLLRIRIAAAEPDRPVQARPSRGEHQPAPIVVDRVAASAPRLVSGSAVEGPLATMLRVPLDIANADRLDRDSVLLVTNVPDYAALSQGQPLGAGTWIVPASKATSLEIIAYAQPSSRQRIAFELLSGDGAAISTANAFLNITKPERADRVPTTVTGTPGTQRLSQMAESALGPRRR